MWCSYRPGGPVATPTPLHFEGVLDGALASSVYVDGSAAAVDGSTATNTPQHVAPAGTFQQPPSNQGVVVVASSTVFADGKGMARNGDTARTCNDPSELPVGVLVAHSSVKAG